MPPDSIQLITVLGAAGALLYVLKLIVDGKLHTSSEVDGLRADKDRLIGINARLAEAIDRTNVQLATIIKLLTEDPDEPQ